LVIDLKQVSKVYPSVPEPVRVLRGIDLRLEPGERVAIIGPSGCGKSTLLNLMGTLDSPTSGAIVFKGRDLSSLSATDLAALRNREIGFVFQLHHLLPQCTLIENVLVPTLVKPDSRDAYQRAEQLLERVGLGGRLHYRPGQLSGGECQRAAVVRALINRPSLLLADEPTGSLNEEGASRLADLLLDLNREEGMAMAVVTHSPFIAGRIGRTLELRDGHLTPRG
jgi:predicted ABC-type transport system involved in lysophospholipase L1 biosynthesis ATPase subunit